jgi:hypothetical protein
VPLVRIRMADEGNPQALCGAGPMRFLVATTKVRELMCILRAKAKELS